MKRTFDLLASAIGILLLSPLLVLISILVALGSGFPVLYRQERVGKGGMTFRLLKFRTMKQGSDKKGLLTVSHQDPRITGIGSVLRRSKLDELPQLFNVLAGDMSLVGPRPEVQKYVAMYSEKQKQVLKVRPGITDYASIEYADENKRLSTSPDPERFYIEQVMPAKLELNLKYISDQDFLTDLKIIFRTLGRILS